MSGKKDAPPRPIDDQIVELVRDWTFAMFGVMFGVSDGPKARRLLGMLRYAASERKAALEEAGCGMAEATLALAARALEHAPKFKIGQVWNNDRNKAYIVIEDVVGKTVYFRRNGNGKLVETTEEGLERSLSSGWTPAPDTGHGG